MTKVKKMKKHVLCYIAVVFIMIIFLYPLSFSLITALKTQMDFLKNPVSFIFKPTLENFVQAWNRSNISTYLWNSVLYTAVSTILTVLLSLLIAFPIARNYIRCSKSLYFLLMMGLFLPSGTIPLFQMVLRAGMYNTRTAYILTLIAIGGFSTMFLTSYLRGIPKELDEAAIMDGCGYFPYVFRVIIPLAKPSIASLSILTAIPIWNDITGAIIFLSDDELFPVAKGIYVFSGQYRINYTELMAALVIVAIPLVILYAFTQRYIISGLTSGAIKM